jgi:hypothetical protein
MSSSFSAFICSRRLELPDLCLAGGYSVVNKLSNSSFQVRGNPMLRKILMASVATATIAGSAIAADLPSRKAPPPAYIPPPILSWQGFYVAVNGGGMWSNSRTITTTAADLGVATLGGARGRRSVGEQYLWQQQ